MNALAKKILLIGFALLPCACAYYPQQHGYYPGNGAYYSGHAIMHRNYIDVSPNHYDHSYAQPRIGNDYSGHQQDRGYDRQFNRNDNGDHHHNFDHRNHD